MDFFFVSREINFTTECSAASSVKMKWIYVKIRKTVENLLFDGKIEDRDFEKAFVIGNGLDFWRE